MVEHPSQSGGPTGMNEPLCPECGKPLSYQPFGVRIGEGISPWVCLNPVCALYQHARPVSEGDRKRLREVKQRHQDAWKAAIFRRDGYKCRVCGSTERLHLAHITTVRAFLKGSKPSLEEAVNAAYSADNIVTLCSRCHYAWHKPPGCGGERQCKVRNLFRRLKLDRGWSSAHEAGGTPE